MSPFDGVPDEYDLAGLKVPPHSLEAEQSVIGGLLIAANSFDTIADSLGEADFYRQEHRIIFGQIARLADAARPHDIVTVADELEKAYQLERAGGFAYLAELAKNTPSVANIRAYAAAVRERAILRHLIVVGQSVADSGYNPGDRRATELIDEAQAQIISLTDARQGDIDLHAGARLRNVVNEWERRSQCDGLVGLSTGFTVLDKRTNGLSPGDLIIIAARPSIGKTTLAMNIVEAVAIEQQRPVLVFSMEMSAEQLLDRMSSSVGKIPFDLIRTGKVFGDLEYDSRIMPTVSRIKQAPLYIDDRAALSIAQMRATARKVHRTAPLGLVVVDYLQLATAKAETRVLEVGLISRGLKALAKELRVPVIAISQLNRQVDSRTDKRPVMSDLRDSGAIEQDADIIWLLYRDEYYNADSSHKGIAEVDCAKQRNGETGRDYLAAILAQCRFDNLAPGWVRPEPSSAPRSGRRGFEYE